MKAAIDILAYSLIKSEVNEAMHREAVDTDDADAEYERASHIRQALAILKAATNGPIWPEPK